ncbi:permease-like cell division protein FtsX [Vibrio rumoiensis]|uniref:Cell division protein FtsX n=1 Tax=Vibrio rumoiensis 1S-45 TaxID=1188252 RepID=A0A1E5E373_9VIBR|nr:permease-like cell division protein FtsX [Vibrio rumoiensis]OEF26117.1 cell division protein FtsX [Vibrio rumoiensis 1S-45]
MVNKKTNAAKKPKAKASARPKSEGFIRSHIKQAKIALHNLLQRPLGTILTLAVVAMSLALPATFYTAGKNIATAAEDMNSASQMSVYFKEGTPEARLMVLKDQLESWPEVQSIQYISSQQGLDDLSQFAGLEKAMSLLSDTALPPVLIVLPKSEFEQTDAAKALSKKLQAQDGVTDVRMDEDWFARLDAIKHLAYIVSCSFAVLMLVSVFLIVGNTLRFNILAHKEEIQVMKMIGATDRFILRPYLYTGLWLGFLGALLAWLMTMTITLLVSGAVDTLANLYDSHFSLLSLGWDESVILLMVGSTLGWIAANLSARKHLKEIEPV